MVTHPSKTAEDEILSRVGRDDGSAPAGMDRGGITQDFRPGLSSAAPPELGSAIPILGIVPALFLEFSCLGLFIPVE